MSWLSGVFGLGSTIEKIATEWIETDREKAEAQTVMLKALDPNGKMRRDISKIVSRLYAFYIVTTTLLIFMHSFDLAGDGAEMAIKSMTDLFVPITTLFTIIVSASFGVNGINSMKGK